MKLFIERLFIILLFVCGYLSDTDGGMFSHIVTGFFMSYLGYTVVYAICYMLDGDGESLFPWVAGIFNILLIFDVYIFLFLK